MRVDPGGDHGTVRGATTTATEAFAAPALVLLPPVVWNGTRIVLIVAAFACAEALAAWCDPTVARYATTLPRGQVAVWNVITAFGTSGYMFAASAAVALVAILWRQRTRGPGFRSRLEAVAGRAAFFFACIALSGIAAQAVKHGIGRMRPKFLADAGAYHVLGPTVHRGADSFPSGHTTSAFAAAVALGLVAPRLRVPLLLVAIVIGLSRIATGNHYPSDVIAGAALGASVSFGIAVWLAQRGVLFVRAKPASVPGVSLT